MEKKNLWGDPAAMDSIRTPLVILREQAAFLGQMTNYLLEGQVHRSRYEDQFQISLSIVAASLDNYQYTILTVEHNIELYPLTITAYPNGTTSRCEDEKEFIETLRKILSSDYVKRIMSNLLSQIKSEL